MLQPIKLTDTLVDEISIIDTNNKYKATTQKGKDGKTFSRFKYDGKVFTVDNDSPFVAAFNNGNVDSVKLTQGSREISTVDSLGEETIVTVDTLAFDSFVSFQQTERRAEHKAKIKRYEHLATAPVTAALLTELMA
jgi:hypothetical protein